MIAKALNYRLPVWLFWLGLIWVCLCLPVSVHAQDNKDKSGVKPQVLSLPSGPGSLEGLGESFEPTLNTGTATYPYKLVVPPGRVGFQPDLTLIYDGGNGNGVWGLGWRLNLSFIQRQTDEGLPTYTDSDRFIDDAGEKLVRLVNGDYRYANEGRFIRYRRLANGGWEAHTPKGIRLLYGESEAARITNQYGIFRWQLERQIDTHGNEIHYRYLKDVDSLYLAEIRYNFNQGGGYNSVLFQYEPRSDVFVDRRSRAPITTGLRTSEIQLWAQGHFVRAYHFGYDLPPTTANVTGGEASHSLLRTITPIGEDGVSALPATTFAYTLFDPTQRATVAMINPPPVTLTNPDADLVDINADSLPDVLYTPSEGLRFYLNQGNGQWKIGAMQPERVPGDRLSSPNTRMADMDGNGRVDLVVKTGSTAADQFYYYAGQPGGRWDLRDRVNYNLIPAFALESASLRTFDANNDKRIDMLLDTGDRYLLWLAQPDATWHAQADVSFSLPNNERLPLNDTHIKLGDMTGDRLQDLVFVRDGLVRYFAANGLGDYAAGVNMHNPPQGVGALDQAILLGDLNNDGLDDLILPGNRTVRYWLNRGDNSFGQAVDLTGTPPLNAGNTSVRLADMDGDGGIDLFYSRLPAPGEQAMEYLDFNTGPQPLLLQSIDNGLGRTIRIDYKPAATYYVADQAANQPWTTTLPFAMQLVSRVTIHDANSSDDYSIDYSYRDGYYDSGQKEFRGFARSEEIEHGDATAATTVTRYRYDTGEEQESRKGLLIEKEVLGEGGGCTQSYVGCYQRENNQLTTRFLFDEGSGQQVAYSFVAQTDTFLHEGQATPAQLRQRFDYDAYGNQTQAFNYGQVCGEDLTCGADEVLKYTEYALNADTWIVNLPAHVRQTDAGGNFVSEMRLYYDGDAYAGLSAGQVTRGDLARQEESLGPLANHRFVPTKRQAFDQYGNVIGIMDANGNRTSIEFDAQSYTFPVVERIYLGEGRSLAYAASYHLGFGKVTGAVDFNGNAYAFVYDAFGRIVKLVKPGDTLALPTQEFVYNLGSPRSAITTQQREQSGADNVLTSVTYFDGLGRKLQTRREAEGEQVVVEAAMTFNARQSEQAAWLPYFSRSFDYTPPDPTLPHTSKIYDPLNRSLRITNPDNSFTAVSYQPLVQVQADEEDNHQGSPHFNTPKTLFYDGLERLVGVEEVNLVNSATEHYTTHYAYDQLGNLTRITDALGNVKTMQYDALSRKIYMDDPDRGEMHYVYDDVSNLLQTTDAKGQTIRWNYDAANRKLTEQWSQSDGSFKIAFTWHYDADLTLLHPDAHNTLGQVTYIEDDTGGVYFSYDARGNVAGRIRIFTTEGLSFVTRYAYDAQDRLSELTYPDGFIVSYVYNAQGLLESIPSFVDNIDYNAAGQRTAIAYPNGATTGYRYDLRQRLDQLRTTAGQRTLQDLAYNFDQSSNISAITDGQPERSAANDQTQTFQYDALYRLTQSAGTYGQIDHAYNAIGNMIRQRSTGADARLNLGEMGYGENGAGPHALTTAGDQTYAYDLNGNRLGKGNAVYAWNPRDWLLSVTASDTRSTYEYDANGQRLRQTVRQGELVTTTLYVDQLVDVRSNELIRYVFDDQKRTAQVSVAFEPARLLQGFGDSVAEISTLPSTTRWYIADHLGGTSLLVDQTAAVISEVAYYPFGLTRYETNGGVAKYRFTGKELDQSGLYYFGARYYDALLSHFVSSDPLYVEQPYMLTESPQRLNIYSYVLNNPTKYFDEDGKNERTPNYTANVLKAGLNLGTTAAGLGIEIAGSVAAPVLAPFAIPLAVKSTLDTVVAAGAFWDALHGEKPIASNSLEFMAHVTSNQLGANEHTRDNAKAWANRVDALTNVGGLVKQGFEMVNSAVQTTTYVGEELERSAPSTHSSSSIQDSPKGTVTFVESEGMMTNRQGQWVPAYP